MSQKKKKPKNHHVLKMPVTFWHTLILYLEPSKMVLMQWNSGHIKANGKSPTDFKGPGSHPGCLVEMSEHSFSQIEKNSRPAETS